MRKLRTTTVRGIRIEADDLIIGLIDRLVKNEKSMESLRQELKDQMEMIAELQPKLHLDGSVSVRAMRIGDDSVEEKIVAFMPITTINGKQDEDEPKPKR